MWVRIVSALIVASGVAGAPARAAAQPLAVDAEIVLAVDASGSVDAEERRVQRAGYAMALRHPDLVRAIAAGRLGRVGLSYFEWAGWVQERTLVPWQVIDTTEGAAAFADAIAALPERPAYGTSIARALEFAVALFDANGLEGAKRIIDVSGDGPNNMGPPVVPARDAAVARGITVNGLPILLDPSYSFRDIDRYFEACVIGGEGAFLLAVRSPEELAPAIRRKLILEISGVPERIVPAAQPAGVDCLAGEGRRRQREMYYPELFER